MGLFDKYREEPATTGLFAKYGDREEEPTWWQKELTTLKEVAKFPYTVTKEFTYPMAKGLVTFPFRPKEAEAEVRETGEMGVEMGKGLGRGMLDWLGLAFPDPVVRQQAMERIGERIKEGGVLAEAIHPLIGLGLGKGALGRAMKLAPKKPAIPVEELVGLRKAPRTFGPEPPPVLEPFLEQLKPKKKVPGRAEMDLPKLKANAELDSFLDYFEDIQAPKGFRPPRKPARSAIRERLQEEGLRGKKLVLETNTEFIKAVHDYGIALRQTKTGKIQPAIREAGTYVPEDFATYTGFKDARTGVFGGTKDVTRFIQEIDGALSAEAKGKLSGGAGPAERYVMWRTRDINKHKISWTNAMKSRLATITKDLSKKQTEVANQVVEHISREGAYVDPVKLVTNPKISALTTDLNVIRFAQEGRKLYESLLRHQNELRRLRGQKEIPHRDYYTAHSIHEVTIWERALGHNKTPEQIVGPGLPDYIKPNAPFNPRAMARELGLPETAREMNLNVLLERYIETAAKDIFNTSIVQNNKAFIQQLKSMGYEHAARGLENWTAEAFGGVRAAVDRVANLSPTIHKGMKRFRQGLLRSVFPLNFAWNSFVQTSSGVLTVTRYGVRNSVKGLYDWFGSKKIRQEIGDNAYSAIIKSQRSGRISQQDINRGIGAAERLNRGGLEKVSDAANFFTEWVERHLTGWSVATARRHGASVGLKDKALWEYASDGGAKTQSMYNLEDLPGMLRSEVVKTTAPFQTFSFEMFNTLREFAGKTGTPPATAAIRTKQALRFLAGATAVNYIGQAAIGRKPWELSSFIPFYGTFIAPVSAAFRGEDVSMTTTRGLPSPVGIAIKGGQAVHRGLLKPGFAATKEFAKTRDFKVALEEFMATGKWDKLRRFTIRYLSGFAGIPGGTQMNRVVDGLIATSAGGMVDSADRLMFPITDTKDKIRSFLAGPWSTRGGQDYWDKRGGGLNLHIEFLEENPFLRDVAESIPVFGTGLQTYAHPYAKLAKTEKEHGFMSEEWKKVRDKIEESGFKYKHKKYLEYKKGMLPSKSSPGLFEKYREEPIEEGSGIPTGTAPPGGGTVGMSLLPVFNKITELIKRKPEQSFIGPQPKPTPKKLPDTPTAKIPYFTEQLVYTKNHPEVADSLVAFAKEINFDEVAKITDPVAKANKIGEMLKQLGFLYPKESVLDKIPGLWHIPWHKHKRLHKAPIKERKIHCSGMADLFWILGCAAGLDIEIIRHRPLNHAANLLRVKISKDKSFSYLVDATPSSVTGVNIKISGPIYNWSKWEVKSSPESFKHYLPKTDIEKVWDLIHYETPLDTPIETWKWLFTKRITP